MKWANYLVEVFRFVLNGGIEISTHNMGLIVMSKFNNRGLALAIAAALTLPATAMAATVDFVPATVNKTYASNLFQNPATSVLTPAAISYKTQVSDNIIGRTTGFGVRLTLVGGPTFGATAPAVTLGAQATGFTPGVASVVGNQAVFPFAAGAGANITVGDLFGINTFSVAGASGVLANGGSVTLKIEIFDSNTNAVLTELTKNLVVIDAVEGTTVTFDSGAGEVNKTIDVAACAAPSAVAAKTQFSPSGDVGASCGAAGNDVFNAGQVIFGITRVNGNFVLANGFAGPNNSGNPGSGSFQFTGTDNFTFTVSGTDFSAFNDAGATDRIFFSVTPNCSAVNFSMTINAAQNSASFSAPNNAPFQQSFPFYFCFRADPARLAEIAAQPLAVTLAIDFTATNVRDPSNRSGALLPLRYNGTVVEFQNVNPASNPRAQSFLRFTNNSAINCPVTVQGRDDDGALGDSTVNFILGTGQSQTFNSENLENGSSKGTGALGDGAGRWYVTATAQCGSFVGSALNRNLEDGTITNLTPQNHGQGL